MKTQVYYEIVFSDDSKSGLSIKSHSIVRSRSGLKTLIQCLLLVGFMYSSESDLWHNGATEAWINKVC